jgi:hypothetical protein
VSEDEQQPEGELLFAPVADLPPAVGMVAVDPWKQCSASARGSLVKVNIPASWLAAVEYRDKGARTPPVKMVGVTVHMHMQAAALLAAEMSLSVALLATKEAKETGLSCGHHVSKPNPRCEEDGS